MLQSENEEMKKYILPIILILALAACKNPDDAPPPNPFDVEIDMPEVPPVEPDSSSLIGLHKFIFSQSCAVPGCHDGAFEPDFRTVQSSYSTLVFQPVIKNTQDGRFNVRVKPFSIEESWLHHRVTTDDQVLGRMPLYDNQLTDAQVKSIEDWIMAGAPDMFGNASALPNTQPQFWGVAAFMQIGPGPFEYRVDTTRDETFSPFGSLNNSELDIWIRVIDDSTAIGDLQVNEVLFSDDPYDFSNARKVDAVYSASPKIVKDFYGTGQDGDFHWKVRINTGNFPANAVTYMKYRVSDGDHAEPFEFPTIDQGIGWQFYMSFYVAP